MVSPALPRGVCVTTFNGMIKRIILICALLSVSVAVCDAQMLKTPEKFEEWLDSPGMRHATVSVEIVDQKTGELYFAYDEQRAVQPASILKLVTTGAALRLLGGDFIMPDTICYGDTTKSPLPELQGYNPDWLIEDINTSYCEGLCQIPQPGITLREYIKETNEKSLNIHAEALAYLLSPEHTLSAGLDSIKSYWTNRGVDTEALVMYDGCGLAPADRVTAHLITELLTDMKDDKDFRNSLAVAGSTGTVKYFLMGCSLTRKAQLKTGTTKSVCGYAGYVRGRNNHTYSVVFIVNNSTEQLTVLRKKIEKMFILLIP